MNHEDEGGSAKAEPPSTSFKKERIRERSPVLPMNGEQGAGYGCVVTFENREEKRLVLHRQGYVRDVLTALCWQALEHDPSFRVICISTVQTVYADLTGLVNTGRKDRPRPEGMLLKRYGLGFMLHPSLTSSYDR